MEKSIRFDAQAAIRAVRAYTADRYRGRPNNVVDAEAYALFRNGMPGDEVTLLKMVCFVGEGYGGADRRYLPHSYDEEAALIVANLYPVLKPWKAAVTRASPLVYHLSDEVTIDLLLHPIRGTKHWTVWATKTLHFLRPDAFPIMDSRAKRALGMPNLASSPRDYLRFCTVFRTTMIENRSAIEEASAIDGDTSPSALKLLDKILYQIGK